MELMETAERRKCSSCSKWKLDPDAFSGKATCDVCRVKKRAKSADAQATRRETFNSLQCKVKVLQQRTQHQAVQLAQLTDLLRSYAPQALAFYNAGTSDTASPVSAIGSVRDPPLLNMQSPPAKRPRTESVKPEPKMVSVVAPKAQPNSSNVMLNAVFDFDFGDIFGMESLLEDPSRHLASATDQFHSGESSGGECDQNTILLMPHSSGSESLSQGGSGSGNHHSQCSFFLDKNSEAPGGSAALQEALSRHVPLWLHSFEDKQVEKVFQAQQTEKRLLTIATSMVLALGNGAFHMYGLWHGGYEFLLPPYVVLLLLSLYCGVVGVMWSRWAQLKLQHMIVRRVMEAAIFIVAVKYFYIGSNRYYLTDAPEMCHVTEMTFFLVAVPAVSTWNALRPGFLLACWVPVVVLVLCSSHTNWQLLLITAQIVLFMSSIFFTSSRLNREQFMQQANYPQDIPASTIHDQCVAAIHEFEMSRPIKSLDREYQDDCAL